MYCNGGSRPCRGCNNRDSNASMRGGCAVRIFEITIIFLDSGGTRNSLTPPIPAPLTEAL